MASKTLVLRLKGAYVCPRCIAAPRTFSTSRTLAAIEPESPRYIDLPLPPQQSSQPRPHIKGTLPVPRDVFRHEPSTDALPSASRPAPSDPRLAFRYRMTALRKQNLEQSYDALGARRDAARTRSVTRTAKNREERNALLAAPDRFDERLTGTTLDPSVRAELARLQHPYGSRRPPDPRRQSRLAKSRARVEAIEEARRVKRQDGLHTLYMNARQFIVDKEGLETAINDAFGTEDKPKEFYGDKPSVWASGAPPKIQDMLGASAGIASGKAGGQATVLKDRVKRIGEVLTGGKMD